MSDLGALRRSLGEGSVCQALSLAFRPPAATLAAELAAVAAPLDEDTRLRLEDLARRGGPDLAAEHHRLLGAGGACPVTETDWLLARSIGGKGGLLGDVAAFYEAFRFEPGLPESPDHVAVELGFLAWMHLKEALALHEGLAEEAEICRDAREKFEREHLDAWLPAFCARLEELAGEGFYAVAARELGRRCAG